MGRLLGVGERNERSEGRDTGLPWDEAEGPIPLATKLPKKASPAEKRGLSGSQTGHHNPGPPCQDPRLTPSNCMEAPGKSLTPQPLSYRTGLIHSTPPRAGENSGTKTGTRKPTRQASSPEFPHRTPKTAPSLLSTSQAHGAASSLFTEGNRVLKSGVLEGWGRTSQGHRARRWGSDRGGGLWAPQSAQAWGDTVKRDRLFPGPRAALDVHKPWK